MTPPQTPPSTIWLSFVKGYTQCREDLGHEPFDVNMLHVQRVYAVWLADPEVASNLRSDLEDIVRLAVGPRHEKTPMDELADNLMKTQEQWATALAGINGMVQQTVESGWSIEDARRLVLSIFQGGSK